MRYRIPLLTVALLLISFPVAAREITALADCTVKVFKEINRTRKWSGKPPVGCQAQVAVEKRPGGVFVAAWLVERADGGWISSAFSGAMDYGEIADKKVLAQAGRDMVARAGRLERCLNSIKSVNDPLECRDRATRSHLAGEESGTETRRLVWLDDTGRHAVVEYAFGTTSATPSPPADLFNGESVLPGVIVELHGNRR